MFPEFFHLLVAAGDDNLPRTMLHSLASAGFCLEEVTSEREAIEVVRRRRFDLVLLGFSQPSGTSIETCRNLRALSPQLRIVMVRADGKPEDDLRALDAGADDCIAAPFRFREIVARLSATLRRSRVKRSHKAILRAGCLEMDPERRVLRRSGQNINLTTREFDLLSYFMRNPEVALTRIKLLRALGESDCSRGPENVRPYIKGLRKKIESDPSNPEYILTEPWVGYRFHNPGRRSVA